MNITTFSDFLQAAAQQPLPQRLLFVFVAVELPADCTDQQRADFDAGHGGTLTPLMCVDKNPQGLASFEALQAEAATFGQPWAMVFAAAMSGTLQQPPTSSDADAHLQRMVESIREGEVGDYLLFDQQGLAVQLSSL